MAPNYRGERGRENVETMIPESETFSPVSLTQVKNAAKFWRKHLQTFVLTLKNPKGTLPKGTARKWKFKSVIRIQVKL